MTQHHHRPKTILDGLLDAVLPFAEQAITKHGEMYRFGAAVTADGQVAMLAADPGSGQRPASQDVLDALYSGARESRQERRAVAFAADVKANGSDAIRVELEHREGTALVLLVPYTRNRFKRTVTHSAKSPEASATAASGRTDVPSGSFAQGSWNRAVVPAPPRDHG